MQRVRKLASCVEVKFPLPVFPQSGRRGRLFSVFSLMFMLAMSCRSFALDEVPVPSLSSPVTDLTQTLTPQQSSALESKLRAFEQRKGSQVAVLIVPTTKPEEIEQYSIRVVDAWKLGRKNVDDGVLLIIAKEDHAVRIEVGKGLEGTLPDVIASRIIRNVIVPQFRNGQFYSGINDAVDDVIKQIDGEPLPAVVEHPSSSQTPNLPWPFLIVVAIIGGKFLRSMLGRLPGAGITAAIVGLVIWWMAGMLLFAILAALFAFIFVMSNGSGGGWTGGGFGSGGFGGGSSGGGWSGGGGGFSGGGASGRW